MDISTQTEFTRRSFDRILDTLQGLSLHRESPKFFIIYAHENDQVDIEAHQNVVRDYISWFKKVNLDVDSDKSPHGWKISPSVAHKGASFNIIQNQICLLPHAWDDRNVDYVLVFYSQLLAEYMRYERNFEIDGKTYSQALHTACGQYLLQAKPSWSKVCNEVYKVQQKYATGMKSNFHHVLTELALLNITNEQRDVKYTIPVILFGNETWPKERKWQPEFVGMDSTQIRLKVESGKEFQLFFKILLELESLEGRRPLIETLRGCFQDSATLLTSNRTREQYDRGVESLIILALEKVRRQLTLEGSIDTERPIVTSHIRDILNLHSWLERLSLKRISGEKLPEHINDIELAVVQKLDSKENDNRKTNREKKKLLLYELFNSITIGNIEVQPRRILIQGKPGIGKTTLCRRLMYEYCWNKNLRKKFELVVRIPIRELEHSIDLSDLLFHEYFVAVERGRELSNILGNLLLGSKVKALIILDGLDEARGWEQAKLNLLNKLIERPDVVITSRSYSSGSLPVDLQLEALGLASTHVDAYLKNTAIVEAATARDICRFIDINSFVRDMIRVPIHLDLLCYCWDEYARQNVERDQSGDSPPLTTTTLYQAVVRRLFRKDIPSMGKVDHGESVDRETVDAIGDAARLERVVYPEIELLEEIAIKMMELGRAEFSSMDVVEAIRRLETKGSDLPLSIEKNLSKLSLLRTHSSIDQNRYSFIHFTFQEFFAAKRIVRELSSIEHSLKQHKYNPQYETIWRFVAGLLDPEDLGHFFDLLAQEPRDIVGIHHSYLIMCGLHECQYRMEPSRRDTIWQELAEYLPPGLGYSNKILEFPEQIVLRQLSTEQQTDSGLIAMIISQLSVSEKLVRKIYEHYIKYRNYRPILALVAHKKQLSEGAISFLMEVIRQGGEPKLIAEDILKFQLTFPKGIFAALHEWLREDNNLRSAAIEILGEQSELPDESIDFAFDLLAADPTSPIMLRSCSNLDRPAVQTLLNLFEKAVDEGTDGPHFTVRLTLQKCILQSSDMTMLEKILKKSIGNIPGRLHLEALTDSIVELLRLNEHHWRQIPPGILKLLVRLTPIPMKEFRISISAVYILRNQTQLHADVIQELRNIFEDFQWKAPCIYVLAGHVPLLDKEFDFVKDQLLADKTTPERINRTIRSLSYQSDLPHDIWIAIPKNLYEDTSDEIESWAEGRVFSDEVVSAFLSNDILERLESWPEGIYSRQEFIKPLFQMIEEPGNAFASKAAFALTGIRDLDSELIDRLVPLLAQSPGSGLSDQVPYAVSALLSKQTKLSLKHLLALHHFASQGCGINDILDLWYNRDVEDFCTSLETTLNLTGTPIVPQIFGHALKQRPFETSSPAYIDGKTISFYRSDGKLDSLDLLDESSFRKKFREAQKSAGFPEWARIQPPGVVNTPSRAGIRRQRKRKRSG